MPKLLLILFRVTLGLLFAILYLTYVPQVNTAQALVVDCATGGFAAGYCDQNPQATQVDCGGGVTGTGQACCNYWAKKQLGNQASATCVGSCQVPSSGETCSLDANRSCLNSSCNGSPVFCCNYSNPPPQPAPVCNSNLDCVDGNPCTIDTCLNPGTASASCTHTNSPAGTSCSATDASTCDGNGNCIPPANTTPTCSSTNCGACSDCASCINNTSCGWNGSSCQSGTASCPAGATQWNWDSCTTNVCATTPPPPPPPASCNQSCTYSQVVNGQTNCYSGTCTDPNNCGYNLNCTYQAGCSSGVQVSCPVPPPAVNSACSVSWGFSPSSTPNSNTNVTATITGTGQTPANFPWANVAYQIDGGTWTTSGLSVQSSTPPTYQANFNSGAAGQHNLQFSAHDSSGNLVVCSGTGTIFTQSAGLMPPTGLSPSGTLSCGLQQVTLTWNATPNASGYDVRVNDNNDAVKSASGPSANNCAGVNYDICINNYQGTSMPINITPGVNYSFWIHSYNPNYSPSESAAASTTFSSPKCGLPNCTISANPASSNSTTLSTTLTASVDTSNMPGSKMSYWSFGDGTNQFTSQANTTHTYTSTTSKTFNPSFKAVDGVSGADLSQSCSTSVTLNPTGSCTLTASPNQSNQPVTSTLTASVDTTNMPGSKMSQWDLDGNGSFETNDTLLNHSVTSSSSTTYQFRVVDGAKNPTDPGYILSGPCSTPVTIGTAPPPGNTCNGSLTVNGTAAPANMTVSARSTISIAASAPTCFTVTLPDGQSQTTCNGSFSRQFDMSNLGSGTYDVFMSNINWGGDCNLDMNINAQQSGVSCDRPYGNSNVAFYTFSDSAFNSTQWPQYHWAPTTQWYPTINGYPYCATDTGGNEGALTTQSNLASLSTSNQSQVLGASTNQSHNQKGQVLAATSCWKDTDCNDNNICTVDSCVGAQNFGINCDADGNCWWSWTNQPGTCQFSPNQQTIKQVCGTSPNEGNMYCGFNTSTGAATGVCSDNLCDPTKGSLDCNDNNACTNDTCNPPTDGDGNAIAGIGTCAYSPKAYLTPCGANPYDSKGQAYCGGTALYPGDGICHSMPAGAAQTVNISSVLCKSKYDCADGNACTDDLCSGYIPAGCDENGCYSERLGACSRWNGTTNTNLPSSAVCQKDASGNPTQLCAEGSSPYTNPTLYPQSYVLSQCNVSYVNCTDVRSQSASCCGITNIQGKACTGECRLASFPDINVFYTNTSPTGVWNNDSKNYFRPEMGAVEVPQTPLAGVTIHAVDDQCGFNQTAVTDARGRTVFELIPYIGNKTNKQTLHYRIWADLPSGSQFTRGSYTRQFSGSNFDSYRAATGYYGPGGSPLEPNWRGYFNEGGSGNSFASDFFTFGFAKPTTPWIQTTGGDVYSGTINTPGGP